MTRTQPTPWFVFGHAAGRGKVGGPTTTITDPAHGPNYWPELGGTSPGAFGSFGGTGARWRSLSVAFFGCSEDLHDVLVPLVGFPPKAQGMSSWKKCGMSVSKVR